MNIHSTALHLLKHLFTHFDSGWMYSPQIRQKKSTRFWINTAERRSHIWNVFQVLMGISFERHPLFFFNLPHVNRHIKKTCGDLMKQLVLHQLTYMMEFSIIIFCFASLFCLTSKPVTCFFFFGWSGQNDQLAQRVQKLEDKFENL